MRRSVAVWCALLMLSGCDSLKKLAAGDPSREDQEREHIEKAKVAEGQGDDTAAVREYESARTLIANDPVPNGALGRLYARQGNDAAAILSLRRAIELANDSESRKVLAEIYMRQNHADLATQVLKGVVQGDGDAAGDAQTQLALVKTLIVSGKTDEALELADKILTKSPGNGDALSAKAEVLLAKGQPDKAAQLLDAAVVGDPKSVDVRLARARFLGARNMHDKALTELERVDVSQSGRADVTFAKARELAQLKRFDEASKVLTDFAATHPNDVMGQSTLAWVNLQGGDCDAARAAAETVLARKPHDGSALYVRARCLEENKENERAIAAYQAALVADPGQVDSLKRLWQLYEAGGAVPDAVTSLETLLQVGAASPEEQVELARLYGETGLNPQRGLKLVEAAAHFTPRPAGLDEIRRKLEHAAAHEHGAGGGGGGDNGGGIEIIRGRR